MSKNKKTFILIACCLIIAIPFFALAAELVNPLGKGVTIQALIGRVISAVLGIVGSIALLMFIYGGFLMMTSHGNEQKITQGKNVLVWATIGLAIIFLSYTLVNFVIKGLTTGGGGRTVDISGEGLVIQGCCIDPAANSCFASGDTECQNGRTFYAKPCNDVPICNPAVTGCCQAPNGTCQGNIAETDCKTTFNGNFKTGEVCGATGLCVPPSALP